MFVECDLCLICFDLIRLFLFRFYLIFSVYAIVHRKKCDLTCKKCSECQHSSQLFIASISIKNRRQTKNVNVLNCRSTKQKRTNNRAKSKMRRSAVSNAHIKFVLHMITSPRATRAAMRASECFITFPVLNQF